ncbi:hypothetical protein SAMN05442782_0897 [Streptomyces sp. OK228]|nr:hypothetical protein SAMN05442782_0897 [Streptomyces sp. OK228]
MARVATFLTLDLPRREHNAAEPINGFTEFTRSSLNHGYQHITEHNHSRESQQCRESLSLRDLPAVGPTSLTSAGNTAMTYSRSRPASYREVELAAQHCAGFREGADRTQSLVTHLSAAPRDSLPICDSWSSGRPLLSAQTLTATRALPRTASVARRLPPTSPLYRSLVSMSVETAVIVPLLGVRPGFHRAPEREPGRRPAPHTTPAAGLCSRCHLGPGWRPGSRAFSRGRRPASRRRRRP